MTDPGRGPLPRRPDRPPTLRRAPDQDEDRGDRLTILAGLIFFALLALGLAAWTYWHG